MNTLDIRDLLLELQFSEVKYRHDPDAEWRDGKISSVEIGKSYMSTTDMTVRVECDRHSQTESLPFDPQWIQIEGVSDSDMEDFEEELQNVQYMSNIARLLAEGEISNDHYSELAKAKIVDEYKDQELSAEELIEVAENGEEDVEETDEQNESEPQESEEFLMEIQYVVKLGNQKWVGLDGAGELATDVESQKSEITGSPEIDSTTGIGDGIYYCIPNSAERLGLDRDEIIERVEG